MYLCNCLVVGSKVLKLILATNLIIAIVNE